jgi:hypothetical protein
VGTPTEPGAFNFSVQVADPEGRSSVRAFALSVTPALAVVTAALPAGEVFVAYDVQLGASGGTPPHTWTLDSGVLPAGLNFTAQGAIGGVPTASGLSPVTVSVHDARGRTATRTLDLAIAPAAGGSPFVAVSFAPNGTAGEPFAWNLTAVGGYPPFVWTVVSGALPSGVSLTPDGSVSGSPDAVGNYTFTVQATDIHNQTANATFTIEVRERPHSIALLPVGEAFALAGSEMTPIEIHWSGVNVQLPLAWSAVGLPEGTTLGQDGNATGRPTVTGTFIVTVTVQDSAGSPASATTTFTITIPQVEVHARQVPTLQVGVPTSDQILTHAGTYALNFTIVDGTLPPGLSIAPDGRLVGTPSQAGTFNFTLRATGPGAPANFDEAAYSITVRPADPPPQPPVREGGLPLEWILLVVILVSAGAFVASRRQLRSQP